MTSRIMIVAGEASGDLHGANLINALRAKVPGLEVCGMGGGNWRGRGSIFSLTPPGCRWSAFSRSFPTSKI